MSGIFFHADNEPRLAVKPHNAAGLFIIMTIIGVGSVPMLAVGMELGCELTRNADGSSSILWFAYVFFVIRNNSWLTQLH